MTSRPLAVKAPLGDLERLRELMGEAGLDAIVASSPESIYYLTGHYAADAMLDPSEATFAVIPRDPSLPTALTVSEALALQLEDFPAPLAEQLRFGQFFVSGSPLSGEPAADATVALVMLLDRAALLSGELGLELDRVPHATYERIRAALPASNIRDASTILQRLRRSKGHEELRRLRHATQAVELAISTALEEIQPGQRELDVDARMRQVLAEHGVEPTTVFVGAAERGALVFSWATNRGIARGDLIRIDLTASYGMYHADLSRNAAVGMATDEQRALYRASRQAMEAAISMVRAGVAVRDVLKAATKAAREAGIADFHRTFVGHGIGQLVHEKPWLVDSDAPIEAGDVLAVEAPYYVYGMGGFSPEDMLFVAEQHVERWTYAPDELPIVG